MKGLGEGYLLGARFGRCSPPVRHRLDLRQNMLFLACSCLVSPAEPALSKVEGSWEI
jgi:hypothetical protein